MKQHAFCFRFETTKNIQNQNKKSIKIQNQNFKFDFQIHSKLYLGTFRLRALPSPRERHIYGDFCIAHFTLPTNTCSFLLTNVRSFHALKFRTLTCESTYLFIVLHKHSIWHFLTSLPKFSTPYKFFHTCIIFPHTHVYERLFLLCKFMVNFGIEFSAGQVFASMNIPIRSPFHTPIYTNL